MIKEICFSFFFLYSPHRSSLPDIPLTPREREILEQTKIDVPVLSQLHHSASSDSILGSGNSLRLTETEPPPKPPLPAFRGRINPDRYKDQIIENTKCYVIPSTVNSAHF